MSQSHQERSPSPPPAPFRPLSMFPSRVGLGLGMPLSPPDTHKHSPSDMYNDHRRNDSGDHQSATHPLNAESSLSPPLPRSRPGSFQFSQRGLLGRHSTIQGPQPVYHGAETPTQWLISVSPSKRFQEETQNAGIVLPSSIAGRLGDASLVNLDRTLHGQLNSVKRLYGIATAPGLCLYLQFNSRGLNLITRVSEETWPVLWAPFFMGIKDASTLGPLPVVGQLEWDADLRDISWLRAPRHLQDVNLAYEHRTLSIGGSMAHHDVPHRDAMSEYNARSRPSMVHGANRRRNLLSLNPLTPVPQGAEDHLKERIENWVASTPLEQEAPRRFGEERNTLNSPRSSQREVEEAEEEKEYQWSTSSAGPDAGDYQQILLVDAPLLSVGIDRRFAESTYTPSAASSSWGFQAEHYIAEDALSPRAMSIDLANRMEYSCPATPMTCTSWGPDADGVESIGWCLESRPSSPGPFSDEWPHAAVETTSLAIKERLALAKTIDSPELSRSLKHTKPHFASAKPFNLEQSKLAVQFANHKMSKSFRHAKVVPVSMTTQHVEVFAQFDDAYFSTRINAATRRHPRELAVFASHQQRSFDSIISPRASRRFVLMKPVFIPENDHEEEFNALVDSSQQEKKVVAGSRKVTPPSEPASPTLSTISSNDGSSHFDNSRYGSVNGSISSTPVSQPEVDLFERMIQQSHARRRDTSRRPTLREIVAPLPGTLNKTQEEALAPFTSAELSKKVVPVRKTRPTPPPMTAEQTIVFRTFTDASISKKVVPTRRGPPRPLTFLADTSSAAEVGRMFFSDEDVKDSLVVVDPITKRTRSFKSINAAPKTSFSAEELGAGFMDVLSGDRPTEELFLHEKPYRKAIRAPSPTAAHKEVAFLFASHDLASSLVLSRPVRRRPAPLAPLLQADPVLSQIHDQGVSKKMVAKRRGGEIKSLPLPEDLRALDEMDLSKKVVSLRPISVAPSRPTSFKPVRIQMLQQFVRRPYSNPASLPTKF